VDTVQAALLEALGVPDWDRDVVLNVYEDGFRIVPAGCSNRFVRIEITLFTGRSAETKGALYAAIAERLGALGVPKADVKVILIEIPPGNWRSRGVAFPAARGAAS
jgi:phenylpyruvate tautomerase PptA (4-oxalocrotonate tautomerase family)